MMFILFRFFFVKFLYEFILDIRIKNIIESVVNKFNMVGCVKWVFYMN